HRPGSARPLPRGAAARLRRAPARPRPRRGLPRVGHRRHGVPGPAGRDRRQRPRARPPGDPVGTDEAGRDPGTRLQLLRHRSPDRTGREAAAARRCAEGTGVFFAHSGSEANEAAFKIARRTGRPRILALTNAFHGRTMGSLALTSKEAYRAPFEPLPGGVEFVEAGDQQALADALAPGDVAAVFAEPIQGEAGVRPLSTDYLRALRRLTREHGTLLVLDEIQTGMGRTGHWFAHQAVPELTPDVMTLAKGLGGGFPVGAVIAFGADTHDLLQPGQHGTTFGGNPLAAAVSLAVIGTLAEDGLLAHARQVGDGFAAAVLALDDPRITGV